MANEIWALVLAAGASRRMGQPKQLLPAAEGSLLQQVVRRSLAADSCRVAVVAAQNGPVQRAHLEELPVHFITTGRSESGLGASLAAGLQELMSLYSPQALMVLLGDQPEVQSEAIRGVAGRFRQTGALIVQARYDDRPAHPVLFHAGLFPELLELSGDNGAKGLLRKYAEQIHYFPVAGPGPKDIDTPEEYRNYLLNAGLGNKGNC
ncbi:NTP transferase domain-containing protein [Paenibacillus sp. S150]|uniref:nucleotidyltransferase family protein n=1 Tax=Paenibacillus sp. S150 TaxID=2749826 RepID=UPI001C55E1A8|nr:nucleotidyltransferase family protein [Paenibacillus sp. S150]MBW4084581.1 nucleotidyltransferase family protein [Paenibacillus sp. S150]